jgi:fumarylacetoacetase
MTSPTSSPRYLASTVQEDSDFSIDNIPFGIGSYTSKTGVIFRSRCMTAIGNYAVDLGILQDAGAFQPIQGLNENVFAQPSLNSFMDHSPRIWSQVRKQLQDLFSGKNDILQSNEMLQQAVLQELSKVEMSLPVEIKNYTDFYSSREHATNVGTMFRGKDNALNPNWLHLPVGYHGRASTVFCSGQEIVRPCGQLQKDPNDPSKGSVFGPCKFLDFELEVAFFVGNTNEQNDYITGSPLTMEQAKKRIFGFVLMNDWSARDIQKWEYVPLGPFTSKNFATTISPWIVTSESLQAFHVPTSAFNQDNPVPLDYLQDPNYGSYNIQLSVAIQSKSMSTGYEVCRSNFRNLYWNAAQQLVHHSVSGCLMRTGDLLGSGTISGTLKDSFGSMLELSWNGTKAVALSDDETGESRKCLCDDDTVIMTGTCLKPNHGRVGFGECRGKILTAGSKVKLNHPANDDVFSPSRRFVDFTLGHLPESRPIEIMLKAKKVSYTDVQVSNLPPVLGFTDAISGRAYTISGALGIAKFLDGQFVESKSLFPLDPIDDAFAIEMLEVVMSGTTSLMDDSNCGRSVFEFHDSLNRLEQMVLQRRDLGSGGPFAMGGFSPTVVECFLIPYLQKASTTVDLKNNFPTLNAIDKISSQHSWFQT